MSQSDKIGISVIICCYNSEKRLPETIRHIASQKVESDIPWELIIVNNASTDRTTEIAKKEWAKYSTDCCFCIVDEFTSGLIYARKTGLDNAKYEIVIFCDDDNWFDDNFLENAYTIMTQNPYIGALGGKGVGVFEAEKPDWFDDFETGYAIGVQGCCSGDISKRGYVFGAGLVSRKKILTKVFDDKFEFLLLGRKENILLAGDDSEMCKRILLLGYKLYYNDSLIYMHYLPANRLTWKYKKKMFEGFVLSSSVLCKYDEIIILSQTSSFKIIKSTFFFIIDLIYTIVRRKNRSSLQREIRKNLCFIFSTSRFMNDCSTKEIINYYMSHK